jgi:hypothetical protein
MAVYEVINPSDMVTFETEHEAALNVAFMQVCPSSGIGLIRLADGEYIRPIFLFADEGEILKWMAGFLGELSKGAIDRFIDEHWEQMAEALESVLYGEPAERKLFAEMMAGMSREAVLELRVKWNDAKRSSMNDYSKVCLAYAAKLRKNHAKPAEVQP